MSQSFDTPITLNDSQLAAAQQITARQGILYKKAGGSSLMWRTLDREYDLTAPDIPQEHFAAQSGTAKAPAFTFKSCPTTGIYLSDDGHSLMIGVDQQAMCRMSPDGIHVHQVSVGFPGRNLTLHTDGKNLLINGHRAVVVESVPNNQLTPLLSSIPEECPVVVQHNVLDVQCVGQLYCVARGGDLCTEIREDDQQSVKYYGQPFIDHDIQRVLCIAYHEERVLVVYQGLRGILYREFDICGDRLCPIGRCIKIADRSTETNVSISTSAAAIVVKHAEKNYWLINEKQWWCVTQECAAAALRGGKHIGWETTTQKFCSGQLVAIEDSVLLDCCGNTVGHSVCGLVRLP
jgi:hypothetical protein